MRQRWNRLALLAVASLGLLGCRSMLPPPPDCPGDPDVAVMELREAWQRAPYHGLYEGGSECSCADCQASVKSKEFIRRQTENLLYRYPRHVPSLMLGALLAYEAGEPIEATGYLDTIFAIQPSHPEAACLRGQIALEAGNLQYAKKLLEDQVAMRPDHAGLHETLASVYYMYEEYDRALVSLDAAERLGGPRWRVLYNRGLVEEAQGDNEAAIRSYRECIVLMPHWPPAEERLQGLQKGFPEGTHALAYPPQGGR